MAQPRRMVYLGRLISGGTDENTGRPFPDTITDIRGTIGEFQTLGVSIQQNAGVAMRLVRKKVKLRSSFWRDHTHLYTTNDAGEPQLYSITTEQAVMEGGQQNANIINLLLTELSMTAQASINIVNGFKAAIEVDNEE